MKKRLGATLAALAVAATALLMLAATASAAGAKQISGLGEPDINGTCNDAEGVGADYAIVMSGDLQGCVYGWIGEYAMHPSGTLQERGHETFVGYYDSGHGTFDTTYLFTGKFEDGDFDKKIFGRCQHPIVTGSGTGVFDGATGRVNFTDDVTAGNFPYTGHIKLG